MRRDQKVSDVVFDKKNRTFKWKPNCPSEITAVFIEALELMDHSVLFLSDCTLHWVLLSQPLIQ